MRLLSGKNVPCSYDVCVYVRRTSWEYPIPHCCLVCLAEQGKSHDVRRTQVRDMRLFRVSHYWNQVIIGGYKLVMALSRCGS